MQYNYAHVIGFIYIEIIRQDKLFLRVKIKQFFKEFSGNEGSNIPEQLTELMEIFNRQNKPLNKIHRYENQFHCLQIQLRKYIINSKKKCKEQCINLFKKQKKNPFKNINTNKSCKKMSNQYIPSIYPTYQHEQISQKNCIHSLQNFHSPSTKLKQYNLHQTQRKRYLSGNMGSSCQLCPNPKINKIQTNNNLLLFNEMKDRLFQKKYQTRSHNCNSCSNHKEKNISKYRKSNFVTPNEYKKSGQLVKNKKINKQNLSNNFCQHHPVNHQENYYSYQHTLQEDTAEKNYSKNRNHSQEKKKNPINTIYQVNNNNIEDISLDHWQPYKYQSNKDQILNAYGLSTIKPVKYQNNLEAVDSISNFQQNIKKQNIFTTPQLLEQCRRIIKYSEMSPRRRDFPLFKVQTHRNFQSCNPTTPSQYIIPSLDPITSPQSFTSVKQLLKFIFQKNWKVCISFIQKIQLKKRCTKQLQQSIEFIFKKIEPKTNLINFFDIIAQIKNKFGIDFSFNDIFQLLDIECKGYINQHDLKQFLQNFTQCHIQPQILTNLKNSFQKFQHIIFEKFKDTKIILACFQYLELIQNDEFRQLCQILELFQFQIDQTESNRNGGDSYQ